VVWSGKRDADLSRSSAAKKGKKKMWPPPGWKKGRRHLHLSRRDETHTRTKGRGGKKEDGLGKLSSESSEGGRKKGNRFVSNHERRRPAVSLTEGTKKSEVCQIP